MTAAPVWQKSSFSGNEDAPNCVELAAPKGTYAILLRESEEPGKVVATTTAGLDALIRHLSR
ncbi:DUF397 domain-containing protein [Streptomyces sp. T-3]|nr:DUF397 domain-containing protein [Streptomyces sp. T-3]